MDYSFIKFLEGNETQVTIQTLLELFDTENVYEPFKEALEEVMAQERTFEVKRESVKRKGKETGWELIWFVENEEQFDRYRTFLANTTTKQVIVTTWKEYLIHNLIGDRKTYEIYSKYHREMKKYFFFYEAIVNKLGDYQVTLTSEVNDMFEEMGEVVEKELLSLHEAEIIARGKEYSQKMNYYIDNLEARVKTCYENDLELRLGRVEFFYHSKLYYSHHHLSLENAETIAHFFEDANDLKKEIIADFMKNAKKTFAHVCCDYYHNHYQQKFLEQLKNNQVDEIGECLVQVSLTELKQKKLPTGQLALAF